MATEFDPDLTKAEKREEKETASVQEGAVKICNKHFAPQTSCGGIKKLLDFSTNSACNFIWKLYFIKNSRLIQTAHMCKIWKYEKINGEPDFV